MFVFPMLKRQNICNFLRSKYFSRIVKLFVFLVFFIFLTHPGRFTRRYDHVPDSLIAEYLVPSRAPDAGTCPLFLNTSTEVREVPTEVKYDEAELAKALHVNLGGWWTPDGCEPVHNVALVIPYRDRPNQLKHFLLYIHEFLQSQLISYRILVVEQAPGKPFNRGKLMNVGYKEALKLQPFPCFIFQDVDLLPQVLKNVYGCAKLPRHMSASINVWRYNLLYHGAFGGAIAMLSDQFARVNGFSNIYFGWGAEDDDLLMRIRKNGLEIIRFSPEVSRYFMLPHKSEVKNPERFSMLQVAEDRFEDDGLNSLNYQVLSYRTHALYTHVIVQL